MAHLSLHALPHQAILGNLVAYARSQDRLITQRNWEPKNLEEHDVEGYDARRRILCR